MPERKAADNFQPADAKSIRAPRIQAESVKKEQTIPQLSAVLKDEGRSHALTPQQLAAFASEIGNEAMYSLLSDKAHSDITALGGNVPPQTNKINEIDVSGIKLPDTFSNEITSSPARRDINDFGIQAPDVNSGEAALDLVMQGILSGSADLSAVRADE